MDLTGLVEDLRAAERREFGKNEDVFEQLLDKYPIEFRELLIEHKVAFGPLPPPGSCKKLVQMDLELTNEYKNSSLKTRPIPAKQSDLKDIMRQIYECSDAKLMSKCEGTEYPKYCSACFLVGKPGSDPKRLVVIYSKFNERLKRNTGSIPNLEGAIERAARTKYKTKAG